MVDLTMDDGEDETFNQKEEAIPKANRRSQKRKQYKHSPPPSPQS